MFSTDGTKVAWLELQEDGYEADKWVLPLDGYAVPLTDHVHRFKVVLYDLSKSVRFTITDNWDRSPDALAVSPTDYREPFRYSYFP